MRYHILCTDKPGHLQTRLDNREAHLAYIKLWVRRYSPRARCLMIVMK